VPQAFRLLLVQGTLSNAATQLSRVSPVITFISAELAGKTLMVSLLMPIYIAGQLTGNTMATRVPRWSRSTVTLVAGTTALQAALVAATAADLAFVPRDLLVYPLLFTSAMIGLITGLSRVALPLAITSLVTEDQAGLLLIRQSAYGAALMTLITASLAGVLSFGQPQLDDAELLWVAALIMGLAAVCALGLGTARAAQLRSESTTLSMRDGFRSLGRQRWFRGYARTQLIFGVVNLGPMFYAIYASESLAEGSDDLDVMLVFIGLGLLGGAVMWTRIRSRFKFRGMYLGSAALSVAAAAVCIVAALPQHLLPQVWIFGIVLLLASVANQAIYPAAQDWLFAETTSDSRPVAISLSQIGVNGLQIGLGFLLGVIAVAGPAIWPLVVVLSASALAVATALSIRRAAPVS
jgi:hypothetical protein